MSTDPYSLLTPNPLKLKDTITRGKELTLSTNKGNDIER
jgi:hypothetical protein